VAEGNIRPLRVLHVVSSGGVSGATQQSLFMPLLTRMPKNRVKAQVVSLAPGFAAGAVLRQNGVPVHDVALSRRRFSWGAFGELVRTAREFRPDVIQAWGHTAQIVSTLLRSRCGGPVKLVWSPADTVPLAKSAGLIDRQKLKLAARFSSRADGIVYTSEAAAALHRRAGFPEDGHSVVPPGVDPMRFKPDFAGRKKVREQLGLGGDAFVIGMVAPFQPGHDHVTLIKAVGELIKTNPKIALMLAGHGVQKGNGPLMALVGGGALGTRTHLLGDWSDISAFYNACDIACSSSLSDSGRLTLVMAMLCGIPCVATGMGAQGEVIGQSGIAVEPNSPAAFIRGITRIMQMPPDRRAFMAQSARKHALTNFVYVKSMQKYLQLYFDLVGRQSLATEDMPTPEIDAAIPAPPPDMKIVVKDKKAANAVAVQDLSDPDSLEAKVKETEVRYKKLKPDPEPPPAPVVQTPRDGDVLEIFEADLSNSKASSQNAMTERARGVADESEDLLSPDELQANVAAVAATTKPAEKPAVAAVTSQATVAKPEAVPSVATPSSIPMPSSAPAASALELTSDVVAVPSQAAAAKPEAAPSVVAPSSTPLPSPVAAVPALELASDVVATVPSQVVATKFEPAPVVGAPPSIPLSSPAPAAPALELAPDVDAAPSQAAAVKSGPAPSVATPSAIPLPSPVSLTPMLELVPDSAEPARQASLFPDVPATTSTDSLQLELLAEPQEDKKRLAVAG